MKLMSKRRAGSLPLNKAERRFLEAFVSGPCDSRELRRALALLWIDGGDTVGEIARRLRVSRQTVYNWQARFATRRGLMITARLTDGERIGRPRTARGVIDPLIKKAIKQDPHSFGYSATVWTAPLLADYLSNEHQLKVSLRSVSYALERQQLA